MMSETVCVCVLVLVGDLTHGLGRTFCSSLPCELHVLSSAYCEISKCNHPFAV